METLISLTDKFTKQQQELYQKLKTAIEHFEKKISVGKGLGMEQIEAVWKALRANECQFFFADLSQINVTSFHFGATIHINYYYSKSEAWAKRQQLEIRRKEICSEYHGSSAVEATEYIHDYLADNIEYNYAASRNSTISNMRTAFTIEGALLEKRAVCEGIAKAARYLLQQLNVESLVVFGEGIPEENELISNDASHCWNLNLLPSGNYHMDITWDLKEVLPLHTVPHQYCNVDEGTLALDHNWDYLAYPRARAMRDNYYVRRNIYFNSQTALERYLERCFRAEEKMITFRLNACAGFICDRGQSVVNRMMQIGLQCLGKDININYIFHETTLVFIVIAQY